MPLDHHIDEERNLVVARVTGSVAPDALIAHLVRVKQDERLRPGYRSFFDLSDADATGYDGSFVRRAADVAQRFDQRTGDVRVAVLAPGNLTFGLARMYSLLVDALQREVRVFREAHAARAWLGCSKPENESEG